jgi:hypothetical protein
MLIHKRAYTDRLWTEIEVLHGYIRVLVSEEDYRGMSSNTASSKEERERKKDILPIEIYIIVYTALFETIITA